MDDKHSSSRFAAFRVYGLPAEIQISNMSFNRYFYLQISLSSACLSKFVIFF